MFMEKDAYPPNVHFIDEYPELQKRVWLRRLAQERLSQQALRLTVILPFKRPDTPDGAA